MSDLLRANPPSGSGAIGRTQNGSSQLGPSPVPISAEPPRGVRTPTEVMRARRDREARKRAAEEAARQRERQEEEFGRQQVPVPVAGVGEDVPGRAPGSSSRIPYDPGDGKDEYSQNRPSGNIPPRQNLSAGGGSRRRTDLPEVPRIPVTQATKPNPPQQPSGPQAARSDQRQPTGTGFPHAFERWEELSAQWEGHTSYWIRKLEANKEELRGKPIDQQLARQVTDLSAAGANLFHAVVELQRLRASSERKFQRWFLETREEREQAQERQAQLERQVAEEREQRTSIGADQIAAVQAEKVKAEELVKEMRRELQISKEEARRAWEELGRREQEERERTNSLRNGEPTVVGGVQVVPMQIGGPSRQTSTQQRPPTRDGSYAGGPTEATLGGQHRSTPSRSHTTTTLDSPGDEQRQFTYQPQDHSPTSTDPFAESGRGQPETRFYAPSQQRATQPPTSSAAISAARAAVAAASPSRGYAPATTVGGNGNGRFYEQSDSAANTTLLNPLPPSTSSGPPPRSGTGGTDERSFIPSTVSSEFGEEEYEINPDGSYVRDSQGNRIPYGSRATGQGRNVAQGQALQSDTGSDEYDVAEDIERERQYRTRYGGNVSNQSPQTTSSGLTPQAGATTRAGQSATTYEQFTSPTLGTAAFSPQRRPDESASSTTQYDTTEFGYGDSQQPLGQPQRHDGISIGVPSSTHHNPTRLSDILEEQERQRSGHTSPNPSRLSYASGGDGNQRR